MGITCVSEPRLGRWRGAEDVCLCALVCLEAWGPHGRRSAGACGLGAQGAGAREWICVWGLRAQPSRQGWGAAHSPRFPAQGRVCAARPAPLLRAWCLCDV